jgi:hypothetical protein
LARHDTDPLSDATLIGSLARGTGDRLLRHPASIYNFGILPERGFTAGVIKA